MVHNDDDDCTTLDRRVAMRCYRVIAYRTRKLYVYMFVSFRYCARYTRTSTAHHTTTMIIMTQGVIRFDLHTALAHISSLTDGTTIKTYARTAIIYGYIICRCTSHERTTYTDFNLVNCSNCARDRTNAAALRSRYYLITSNFPFPFRARRSHLLVRPPRPRRYSFLGPVNGPCRVYRTDTPFATSPRFKSSRAKS
jgi:hypothetical protein